MRNTRKLPMLMLAASLYAGCSYGEYKFNERIGNEFVSFDPSSGTLKVFKSDNTCIVYNSSDLKVSSIAVGSKKEDDCDIADSYNKDTKIGGDLMGEAQRVFDKYMKQILAQKKQTAREIMGDGPKPLPEKLYRPNQ